jgi:hypothetical protein
MDEREPVDREPTRTFSSVDKPGSMTMWKGPPAVVGQSVTVPVSEAVVSPEVIEPVSVQAGAAPAYDLLVTAAIYSPNPVQISL